MIMKLRNQPHAPKWEKEEKKIAAGASSASSAELRVCGTLHQIPSYAAWLDGLHRDNFPS
jgi:hypothetical protein